MIAARLKPQRDRAAGWWNARSRREQGLLLGLACVMALALMLAAVVRPLEAARARALADLRTADMIALRASAGGFAPAAAGSGPPGAAISRAAAGAGVSVQSIQPEGGGLAITLADAPFEAVLRFVAALENESRLRLGEARVERSSATPGLVSAQFKVAG